MANEFIVRNGLIAKASSIISGSIEVTGAITGSGAGLTNIPSAGLTPPGSDTQILFNSDGSLAANSGLVYSGSRLGIGTTSPAAPLAISNGGAEGIELNYNVGNEARIISYNRSNSTYRNLVLDSAFLRFKISGTEKFIINGSGNVGIGEASPSAKLHVSGTSDVLLVEGSGSTIFDVQGSQGQLFSVTDSLVGSLFSVNDISGLPIIEVFDTDKVVMGTFGQNTLVVTGSLVGIGTGTPNRPLTIETNTTDVVGALKVKNAGTGDASMFFQVNASGNVWQLGIDNSDGDKFKIGQDNSNADVGVGTKLTIDTSGNVGIGNTNPSYKLEVTGDARVSGSLTFTSDNISYIPATTSLRASGKFESVGALRTYSTLRVDSNADIYGSYLNVGQAVTTSEVAVTIGANRSGNGYSYIDLVGDATYTDYGLRLIRGNSGPDAASQLAHRGTGSLEIRTAEASPIRLITAGATRMHIDAGGNVGIGTTEPTEELHIYRNNSNVDRQLLIDQDGAGDATLSFRLTGITEYAIGVDNSDSDKFKIAQSSGVGTNDRLTIDSTGNVGIGTTSPGAKLDISAGSNDGIRIAANNAFLGSTTSGDTQLIYWNGNHAYYGRNPGGAGIVRSHSFRTEGNTKMFITGSSVGINTQLPTGSLHVIGSGYFEGESLTYGFDQTYGQVALLIDEGDYIYTRDSNVTLRKLIGKASDVIHIGQTGTSLIDEIRLTPGTTNGIVSFYNDNSEYARFQGGSLGIGTNNPGYELEVVGHVSASAFSGSFKGDGSGLSGVTATISLAEVLGTGNDAGGNDIDNVGALNAVSLNATGTISGSIIRSATSASFGGPVGIGTTNIPTAKLQVAGIISGSKLDLPRGGYITFYGDDDGTGDHSISARDANGNASDDLRINSFHNVYVNLDSNNNNSSNTTSFSISQHGGTGTLGSSLFSVRGDGLTTVTGDLTVTGALNATASYATNLVNIPSLAQVLNSGEDGGGFNILDIASIEASGTVTAGTFVETSARRFKENIEPISNSLEILSKVEGITFNRIGEERREYGFIADDILDVAPELVSHDENGEVHGVHYARAVAILTEAVKELDNKVKAQDLFIKDLVARIEKLENK